MTMMKQLTKSNCLPLRAWYGIPYPAEGRVSTYLGSWVGDLLPTGKKLQVRFIRYPLPLSGGDDPEYCVRLHDQVYQFMKLC